MTFGQGENPLRNSYNCEVGEGTTAKVSVGHIVFARHLRFRNLRDANGFLIKKSKPNRKERQPCATYEIYYCHL
jgi:hypothetical protein